MIKYSIKITFKICLLLTVYTVLIGCKTSKSERVYLPAALENKKWVKLYDEQSDGKFWLNPFYHRNFLESFTEHIECDAYDRKLIPVKIEKISATQWQLGVLEHWEAQDTLQLNINCIDTERQIYQFKHQNNNEANNPFSGYFMAVPQYFVPEFYPEGEHYTKYDRIIDHRFEVNGVTAPAPLYFLNFYNARKNFLQKYGDYTAMEVESIESYLTTERDDKNGKGRWQIVADNTCHIPLPGFAGEFPHRYILVKININDEIYDQYFLYIFAKLSEKYSCILVSDFTANKSDKVKFELNCDETARVPIAWDEKDTNARYWETCYKLSGCYTKGGFSLYFGNRRSDYLYVINITENMLNSPLHIIPDVRWRLIKAGEGDEEIHVLSEYESLILGSGEDTYISTTALYDEKLRQGLIEEEYDDYSPDE